MPVEFTKPLGISFLRPLEHLAPEQIRDPPAAKDQSYDEGKKRCRGGAKLGVLEYPKRWEFAAQFV